MGLARVFSRAQIGIDAPPVSVEVHVSNGFPALSIVGLPETVVRESKDRVRSAIQNSGFDFPARRITVNLAPADLPKDGGRFDLPIALGLLVATKQLRRESVAEHEFIGELSLGGGLRSVRGAIPAALAANKSGRALVVPAANAGEAALVRSATVFGATHLLEVCGHLAGESRLEEAVAPPVDAVCDAPDLADVRGQAQARRALELAAAGRHSLLMTGPPGTGKSMLAQRIPGILPAMSERESLTALSLSSLRGGRFDPFTFHKRPFRNPHHSCSAVALIGGGGRPLPGEVSLAHGGVLFLDELPEFPRQALEALREPLEMGQVVISRARAVVSYPARFQLIGAMNPCPCGYLGDPKAECRCTTEQVSRYRLRISGPLLDRIDMHVAVFRIDPVEFDAAGPGESSEIVRERVQRACRIQVERQQVPNAWLNDATLERIAGMTDDALAFLQRAALRLNLSGRGYYRTIRLARTIADLAAREEIGKKEIAEALSLREPQPARERVALPRY